MRRLTTAVALLLVAMLSSGCHSLPRRPRLDPPPFPLEGQKPGGRLQPSKIHETMQLQISLTARGEVDSDVLDWLQQAYDQNC